MSDSANENYSDLNDESWLENDYPFIKVQIIADSVSRNSGQRLTTFQLEYPRFILAEVNTHRVFSRNSASSRAIPIEKMVEQVENNPVTPIVWLGKHKGMQGVERVKPGHEVICLAKWRRAAREAAMSARKLNELGVSKQLVNRLLEPFCTAHTVLTSTSFDNFFALRDHPDAENHMRYLAHKMRIEYDKKEKLVTRPPGCVVSTNDFWHLPYVSNSERIQYPINELLKMSTARCARVSFKNHDNTNPVPEKDFILHDSLVGSEPKHASPAEHQAYAYGPKEKTSNLDGWLQYRTLLEPDKWKGYPYDNYRGMFGITT